MAEIQEKSPTGPFDVIPARSARRFFKFAAILAAFFVLAGATGYYFLIFKQQKQTPKADEIVITDLPTGEKLVENKTQRYSVKVPSSWNIEKPSGGYFSINNIDPNKLQNEFCKIEFNSINNTNKFTPDTWLNRDEAKLNESFMTITKDERKPINVDNLSGIERTLETAETGLSISVVIATSQKLYEIVLYPKGAENAKCINIFNTYLSSLKLY